MNEIRLLGKDDIEILPEGEGIRQADRLLRQVYNFLPRYIYR